MSPEVWWAEGLTVRLYLVVDYQSVDDHEEVVDSWAENTTIDGDGESWEIRVDDRGIAYTHVWSPHGPLRLDELPEEP